ncbi:MAG: universal stress protein [Thermoleophilia bacterium]|nr:universal stress protein [Gaiellaceae bacterium]MDW8338897.1 universal stress protein [Thermoleophilia bacterium]
MKTIVLAYNDTDGSNAALERAAELARFYGARLVVTSVVPVLVGGDDRPSGPGEELRKAEARLRELGHEPELVEAVGDIGEAIVEVAERRGADLIVLGTRELSQVERMLGYSVSETVQRMARCDVLIVHPRRG